MLSLHMLSLYTFTPQPSLVSIASDQIQQHYNVTKSYIGIIDAGSTGTRLNIYAFLQPGNILAYYSTKKSSPGLHLLENDEIDAVINYLLVNTTSKMEVLGVRLEDMVFGVQGTAGLRTMSKQDQDRVLGVVENHFKKKRLKLKNLEVISGVREGFLALMSLNILVDYKKNIMSDFGCQNKVLKGQIEKYAPNFCTTSEKEIKYKGLLDMGGGSIQVAYEFDKDDKYEDDTHIIRTVGKNIYINSYPGWGLKEGIKVLKENYLYKLKRKNGKEETMFDRLLADFRTENKPDINNVEELYLTSYFYDNFKRLGCKTKTNLNEVKELYGKNCNENNKFCTEIYYMYKFLEAQGVDENKRLFLLSDIAGISMNWSLSSALILSTET